MPGFSSEVLTANEAAAVTAVPLKQVHRIIDAGLLSGRVETRRGSRLIAQSGLVGLRLAWLTADTLTPAARRRIVESAITSEALTVVAAGPLKVDLKPIASEVKAGLSRLKKANAMVAREPGVLGGQPVFAGTRVLVHDIAEMLANGISPRCLPMATRPRLFIEPTPNSGLSRSNSQRPMHLPIHVEDGHRQSRPGGPPRRNRRALSVLAICRRLREVPDRRMSEP